MPFVSKQPSLKIPECSILDYLFAKEAPSDEPLWIDSTDVNHFHSAKSGLAVARRLGFGLQQIGVQSGDRCLLFTPNHIYVPVAYMAIVGLGAAFSGANPAFTEKGMYVSQHDNEAHARQQN